MRVAFVPRSAEIQPLFWRFVTFIPSQPSSSSSSHCILILAITLCCCRSIWPYTTYPSSSFIDLHNIKHIEWCTSYIMYIVHSFNQHQKSSYPLLLSGVTTINHSSSSSRPSHHRKKVHPSLLSYRSKPHVQCHRRNKGAIQVDTFACTPTSVGSWFLRDRSWVLMTSSS